MNAHERRKQEREGIRRMPEIQGIGEGEQVLARPQHWHVGVVVYQDSKEDGATLTWSTHFELTSNDIEAAESKARRLARRPMSHLTSVRQCSDPQHWEGIEDAQSTASASHTDAA